MRRVMSARADNTPRRFIPAAGLPAAARTTGSPQSRAAMAYYCALNL